MAEPKKEAVRNANPRRTAPDDQQLAAGLEALRILEPTAPAPMVNVKKTEPRIADLDIGQGSPVTAASSGKASAFESIPKWFCWGLLGISSVIFLIQIWNYALS